MWIITEIHGITTQHTGWPLGACTTQATAVAGRTALQRSVMCACALMDDDLFGLRPTLLVVAAPTPPRPRAARGIGKADSPTRFIDKRLCLLASCECDTSAVASMIVLFITMSLLISPLTSHHAIRRRPSCGSKCLMCASHKQDSVAQR